MDDLEQLKIKRAIASGMMELWKNFYEKINKQIILKELLLKMKGETNGNKKARTNNERSQDRKKRTKSICID